MALTLIGLSIVVVLIAHWLYKSGLEWLRNRWRLVQMIEKIPGPPAIPIMGNTHEFKLDRVGEAPVFRILARRQVHFVHTLSIKY